MWRLPACTLLLLALGACASGNGSRAQDGVAAGKGARAELQESRQLVLVVGDGWNASTGILMRYVPAAKGWTPVGEPVPVTLGRNGLAWGNGLHDPVGSGPQKREGDGRAPAGLFRITRTFGVAEQKPADFHMPYLPLHDGVECVDDTGSAHYNRIVDAAGVEADWKSSERMNRVLPFYRWGATVAHNAADPSVAGGGSCIFLHIWGGPTVATSGCTAMAEQNLLTLLRWLDEDSSPLLLQLPREEYTRFRSEWGLP